MKTLLNNRFRPVTDGWGFIKAPFSTVADAVYDWMKSLHPQTFRLDFESSLEQALGDLEPFNEGPFLVAEGQGAWTALFRAPDGASDALAHLAREYKWEAVDVEYVEDDFDYERQAGRPGGVQMALLGGSDADEMNYSRLISATNQCNRWEFDSSGRIRPFEQPERYKARRIRDRFTPEMLDEYCQALGIRPFDETFYGPRYTIVRGDAPDTWEGIEHQTYQSVQQQMREAEQRGR